MNAAITIVVCIALVLAMGALVDKIRGGEDE